MERKNYTVAVDLGSSNVVVAVGEKNAEERLDVVCVVSKPVEGPTTRPSWTAYPRTMWWTTIRR